MQYTKERLLRNPKDIASIYRKYYGKEVASKVNQLLTEHLVIGGDLITALKNGESNKADELNRNWHKNNENGVKFVYPSFSVTLRDRQREYFYNHIDKDMRDKYIQKYKNCYQCTSYNYTKLKMAFNNACKEYNISSEMPL